ncbi:ammonia-dependent NAD(+) synthetase [Aestuariimicrobium sp. p3-SID1156]|uniref:ammonia-dependent NAD(+) synthetase n=1 Tax=Aestuariimicrobium sp. p3-SID1156 TaxID=2916038 RepID=UPI00223B4696|nr:ammonia-dependent NAD(+) synthetase [Aestuariimicrobium sp. p3-SID1156]MCT1458364.1 ammonia-dependent NAD(+) synthetase [Aestuariimicrobium sp. p3-SID1156]
MRELQQTIVDEMGVSPEIDPAAEVERRIQFLIDYLRASHTKGFVLGISGGVDSTLAGRLAQLAVQRLHAEGMADADFVAVRLPYGVQSDEADAAAAMRWIGANTEVTLNIKDATDGMEAAFEQGTGLDITDFNKGNVKARMRMVAQYTIAGERNLLVIGTDHASESVTGFFTKFGDGGADILPLFGLDKRQNRELLRHLGAPEQLWAKVPTADLLDDQPLRSDEEELGLAYDQIDAYVEGREVPEDVAEKIEQKWTRSRHKRSTPVTINDSWWRE